MNTVHQDPRISLRQSRDDDEEFLVALYRSTREAELAMVPWDEAQRQAFVRSQYAAQLDHYQKQCPRAEHQILEFEGQPVGRVYVDRRGQEIRILDLTLMPDFRGRGLGSPIILGLMDEAARTYKTLSINLESFGPGNRSQRLFERLGFKPTESSGFHTLFVWSPATSTG